MRRYIDADKLKEFYKPYAERKLSVPVDVILLNIDDMPSADVVEVKHGRWTTGRVRGSLTDICSVCGCDSGTIYHYNYCPNCGAKMDEVEDTYCTDETCETFLRDLNCERCTK